MIGGWVVDWWSCVVVRRERVERRMGTWGLRGYCVQVQVLPRACRMAYLLVLLFFRMASSCFISSGPTGIRLLSRSVSLNGYVDGGGFVCAWARG